MTGKTKQQKKKRAKMKKRTVEEQNRQTNVVKRKVLKEPVASVGGIPYPEPGGIESASNGSEKEAVLGNNAASPPLKVNEDAGKDEIMEGMEKAADLALKRVEEMEIEDKPFDPKSVVANILKKKDGA